MNKKLLFLLLAVLLFVPAVWAVEIPIKYDIVACNSAGTAETSATVKLYVYNTLDHTSSLISTKTGYVVTFKGISPSAFGQYYLKGQKPGYYDVVTAKFNADGPEKVITKYLSFAKRIFKPATVTTPTMVSPGLPQPK